MTNMNTRKSKPTSADIQAAAKLKRVWTTKARELGITQDSVADRMGITQGAVSQYLNGKIPMNYLTLVAFASALEIDPSDIRTDLPEQALLGGNSGDSDHVDVLGYGQAVGLSDGAELAEYATTHSLKFKASSLRRKHLNPNNLRVMYGQGDSMEPDIRDGDAILFDVSDTHPKDGSMYVLMVYGVTGESYTVKECMEIEGEVYFGAKNPYGDHNWKRPRRLDSQRNPITIIGRVVWTAGWV